MNRYRILHIPSGEWLRQVDDNTETVTRGDKPWESRFQLTAVWFLYKLCKHKKTVYVLHQTERALLPVNKSEFLIVAVNNHLGFADDSDAGRARKAKLV